MFCSIAVGVLLFLPVFPWSAELRYKADRLKTRAGIRLAELRGQNPRLISIAGQLDYSGVQVIAVGSKSGWAALTDNTGKFTLPDVEWYPGANYDLIVIHEDGTGSWLTVKSPSLGEGTNSFDAGRLAIPTAGPVDLAKLSGITSVSHQEFDSANHDYYRETFYEVTKDFEPHQQKLEALNTYVATKLNYREAQWELGSPRRVLENGSRYCGHLCSAFATLAEAGGYRTRELDMTDGRNPAETHRTVEVFYDGSWHLFDPTFGLRFTRQDGSIASYREVRLGQVVILNTPPELMGTRRKIAREMPDILASGLHHIYLFR